MDIFFEALNYEKIEQKKAYEIAGLLGKILEVSGLLWQKNVLDLVSALSAGPHHTFHVVCSRLVLWGFLLELVKQAEHIFIIWCSCKGSRVGSDEKLGWMDTFDSSAQITLRDTELEVTAWGMLSCTIVQLLYLPISVNLSSSRWHWRSDGAVYRSQCLNNTGNIWLPIWGKVMVFTN